MFFMKSALVMIIGLMLTFVSFFVASFFPIMIILLPMWFFGAIFCFISLARIWMDVRQTTLYYLIEEPRPGEILWLYAYGDRDMVVTPAMRRMQMYSYSPELNQQIKEFATYRFAGHTIRVVPEGIGHSVDLGACLYATHFKQKFGIRNIFDLRKLFRPAVEDLPEEKVTTVEKAHEMLGLKAPAASFDHAAVKPIVEVKKPIEIVVEAEPVQPTPKVKRSEHWREEMDALFAKLDKEDKQ